MAKVYKKVDPFQPETSDIQCEPIDWKKCALCQTCTSESLSCPANSIRGTDGLGYKTTAESLIAFESLGCLPKTIKLATLDGGDGIEESFKHHKAKWHNSCRLKFSKSKLKRAEKRKELTDDAGMATGVPQKLPRRSMEQSPLSIHQCFFCDRGTEVGESLHKVSTLELDVRVRRCALQLQDTSLLAKLSAGDMVAQDGEYHLKCLVSLYNRERETNSYTEPDVDVVNHGIAFAELLSYIEDARQDKLVSPVFQLSDLVKLYSSRLEQLGTIVSGRIHSTKLKDRLLSYFPDMEAHTQGREVVIVCNEDIGTALRKACAHDTDSNAVHLARAATIIRRHV